MIRRNVMDEFRDGLIKGIPICLGYFPVSFTFGIMTVTGGLPPWLAVFTSLSNLTSAGQFAGVQLIFTGASLFEIGLTTFVINMRYMLMSLSLSQKIDMNTAVWKRLIFGFGITDEIYAIASTEKKTLTAAYMNGLMLTPILGWTAGTAAGAFTSGVLPDRLSDAMGIALYGMFIAIIIPPAKKSIPVLLTVLEAALIMSVFRLFPVFAVISDGFKIILATIIAAGLSAFIFPVDEDSAEGEAEKDTSPDGSDRAPEDRKGDAE